MSPSYFGFPWERDSRSIHALSWVSPVPDWVRHSAAAIAPAETTMAAAVRTWGAELGWGNTHHSAGRWSPYTCGLHQRRRAEDRGPRPLFPRCSGAELKPPGEWRRLRGQRTHPGTDPWGTVKNVGLNARGAQNLLYLLTHWLEAERNTPMALSCNPETCPNMDLSTEWRTDAQEWPLTFDRQWQHLTFVRLLFHPYLSSAGYWATTTPPPPSCLSAWQWNHMFIIIGFVTVSYYN